MIIWFFLQSLLTFISFILLIVFGNYSDGAVGMTPLALLLALAIQLISSFILYFGTRKFVNADRNYIFFIANMILYELSFIVFSEAAPVMDIFKSGFEGFMSRCYTFSSVISGACIIVVFLLSRLKRT